MQCSEREGAGLAFFIAAIAFSVYLAYGAIGAPSGIYFSGNASSNFASANFSVNWTAVTGAGVYYIYNNTGGGFGTNFSNTSAAGYAITGAANGQNYTFIISAVNATNPSDITNSTNSTWMYVDTVAPAITLTSPSNAQWNPIGRLNFTFTVTDNAAPASNCSLWLNSTGTWKLNMTNSSALNNTQSVFVFDNGANVLGNGTYIWNVQCYDSANNSAWAQNYTFTVGTAPDFIVTNVSLANSSAPQWNNPIPGSNLTINATIMNNGTANTIFPNISVALLWDGLLISQQNISNQTLTANSSTTIQFNISAGNLTDYGSHNITVVADYGNAIPEIIDINNNRTLAIFGGLNISTRITGSSANPGASVTLNVTALYQNGSAVANLISTNFTVYDIYAYDNGTTTNSRNFSIAPANFDGTQNASGIYLFNITAQPKYAEGSASSLRAEYGNHTVRIFVSDNKSVAYYGWDNRTSNYYAINAPNLAAAFGNSSYYLDLASAASGSGAFAVSIKNNGTSNISNISIMIISNSSSSLTLKSETSNYSATLLCNYSATLFPATNSSFASIAGCSSLTFNTTTAGSYLLTAYAGGLNNGNASDIYNATAITTTITIANSTSTGSSSSSGSGSSAAGSTPAVTYTYALDFADYNKTALIEQGGVININFSIKNTGNGTVNNISLLMALPENVVWEKWYNATPISILLPDRTAVVSANITSPKNATIRAYTITAKAAGAEAGSAKTTTFILQVTPGDSVKKAINASIPDIEAEISQINGTISKLLESGGNENITLASKKLAEARRLLLEAKNAILKGDYLSAYSAKNDIDALIPEINQILSNEKSAIETAASTKQSITIGAIAIIVIIAVFYYLWMPEEGYTPGKGYVFRANGESATERVKEKLRGFLESINRAPKQAVRNIEVKEDNDKAYISPLPKEQAYSYSRKNENLHARLKKMSKNVIEQLKEQGGSKEKPAYNFHKKQRWSSD